MKTTKQTLARRTNDKGWAQLYADKPVKLNHRRMTSTIAPLPLQCTFGFKRLQKAVGLFLATNYSWSMSWNMAASN